MRIKFENAALEEVVRNKIATRGVNIRGDLIYTDAGYAHSSIPEVINGIGLRAKVVYWGGNEVDESLIYVGFAGADERLARNTGWILIERKIVDPVGDRKRAFEHARDITKKAKGGRARFGAIQTALFHLSLCTPDERGNVVVKERDIWSKGVPNQDASIRIRTGWLAKLPKGFGERNPVLRPLSVKVADIDISKQYQ